MKYSAFMAFIAVWVIWFMHQLLTGFGLLMVGYSKQVL
jgi:hypothetical protein